MKNQWQIEDFVIRSFRMTMKQVCVAEAEAESFFGETRIKTMKIEADISLESDLGFMQSEWHWWREES